MKNVNCIFHLPNIFLILLYKISDIFFFQLLRMEKREIEEINKMNKFK